jgi:hypothetical protein
MIVATSLDEDYDPEWAPSPEEIAAARDEIYAGWSDEEREQRRRSEYVSTRLKRYVADFSYQKRVDGEAPQTGPLARNKRYRERHRELIRAKRRDPAYKEKHLEWSRRHRERAQFLIKERVHSNKDQENAKRKSDRQAMDSRRREEIRERRRRHYAANREAILEQLREARSANRDEFNARRRERAAKRRVAVIAC